MPRNDIRDTPLVGDLVHLAGDCIEFLGLLRSDCQPMADLNTYKNEYASSTQSLINQWHELLNRIDAAAGVASTTVYTNETVPPPECDYVEGENDEDEEDEEDEEPECVDDFMPETQSYTQGIHFVGPNGEPLWVPIGNPLRPTSEPHTVSWPDDTQPDNPVH